MKFIDFLKSDLKKIIVLLIFLTPTILVLIWNTFKINIPNPFSVFPASFEIVNGLINTAFYIGFVPFLFGLILTSFDKTGSFAILFIILFMYLITCIILFLWNRIFDYFGDKKKQYEKFAVVSLIILFIFIPIMLDGIIILVNKTRPNLSIEIDTRPNISIDEYYKYTIPPFYQGIRPLEERTKLQELRIHNYLVSQVRYELPEVTACIYDVEENLKLTLILGYITEDIAGDGKDLDNYELVVKPDTERKAYLQIYSSGELQPKELFTWNLYSQDILAARNIQGYDNNNAKLLESLKQDFGVDWAKNAIIEKDDENRTIVLFDEKNRLSLSLNNEKTKVNLTIDDGRTYELFVITNEWNQLYFYNIYKPIEKEKFDEILLFKTVYMNDQIYCHNATDEEVLTAEKIKIIK